MPPSPSLPPQDNKKEKRVDKSGPASETTHAFHMSRLTQLTSRPRRNRKSHVLRGFHRETWLAPQHFVLPLFIHDGAGGPQPIASMPGCARLDAASLVDEVAGAVREGIGSVVLFPAI